MKFDVLTDRVGFCEGPVHCQDKSILVTSLSDGVLYRLADNEVSVFSQVGGGPNGLVEGLDGAFFVAQSGGVYLSKSELKAAPGVQKVAKDGTVSALQAGPHSPNDLAFGPDGYLYVTDPTRRPARDDGRLWRYDVASGEGELLATMDWFCNGIGFSTEADCFYVADTRCGRILRFRLDKPTVDDAEVVIQIKGGVPDGFAIDVEGNFVIATIGREHGDDGGVQVWSPQFKLQEEFAFPGSQHVTNIAIAPDRTILVTDSSRGKVLVGTWHCAGLPLHPFRQGAARSRLSRTP